MKFSRIITYPKSILVTLLILFLSFSPPSSFNKLPNLNLFSHFDKFAHFLLYFLLTFMLLIETKSDNNKMVKTKVLWLICLVFPVVLGGIVEIMQEYFFPPRTAELIDWFANIAGVIMAWILMSLYHKLKSETT